MSIAGRFADDVNETIRSVAILIFSVMILTALYQIAPDNLKETVSSSINSLILIFKIGGIIGGIGFLIFLANWIKNR